VPLCANVSTFSSLNSPPPCHEPEPMPWMVLEPLDATYSKVIDMLSSSLATTSQAYFSRRPRHDGLVWSEREE